MQRLQTEVDLLVHNVSEREVRLRKLEVRLGSKQLDPGQFFVGPDERLPAKGPPAKATWLVYPDQWDPIGDAVLAISLEYEVDGCVYFLRGRHPIRVLPQDDSPGNIAVQIGNNVHQSGGGPETAGAQDFSGINLDFGRLNSATDVKAYLADLKRRRDEKSLPYAPVLLVFEGVTEKAVEQRKQPSTEAADKKGAPVAPPPQVARVEEAPQRKKPTPAPYPAPVQTPAPPSSKTWLWLPAAALIVVSLSGIWYVVSAGSSARPSSPAAKAAPNQQSKWQLEQELAEAKANVAQAEKAKELAEAQVRAGFSWHDTTQSALAEARRNLGGYSANKPPPLEPAPPSEAKAGEVREFDGMPFAWIPPGNFQMGSAMSEDQVVKTYGGKEESYNDTQPVHTVTFVQGFWMGQYEVTNRDFQAFVNATGCMTDAEKDGWGYEWIGQSGMWGRTDGISWRNPRWNTEPKQPVVLVSWTDGTAYCEWLSKKTGKRYRLPSEAEWEYACRAGATTEFCWGDRADDGKGWLNAADLTKGPGGETLTEKFNFEDGYWFVAPVGSFKSNAWNLYDMHGNAWEWCQDWYHANYEGAPSDGSAWDSPAGQGRVARGGSWNNPPRHCRAAFRGPAPPPNERDGFGGLRLVRTP